MTLGRAGKKTKKWIAFRDKYLNPLQNHEGYWVCADCKTWTAYPEVDHIEKRSLRPDLVFDKTNLRILCARCHRKRHS